MNITFGEAYVINFFVTYVVALSQESASDKRHSLSDIVMVGLLWPFVWPMYIYLRVRGK